MKNRIIAVLLAVLMALPLMIVPLTVSADAVSPINEEVAATISKEEKLASMSYVTTSEDGKLALYVDASTGEMGIKNTVTGEITLSNPADALENGDATRLSQVYINFFAISSGKGSIRTFYSYADCFKLGQANVVLTEDGVDVHYSLGEEWRDYVIPVKISIEKLLNALTAGGMEEEKAKKLIKDNFNVFDPKQKFIENFLYDNESMANEVLAAHPLSGETPYVYLPMGTFNSNYAKAILENKLVSANSDYFRFSEPGEEKTQFELDCEELLTDKDREDYKEKEMPNFKLTVQYKITNDGLDAILNTNSIKYDTATYCVANITVLPYFAATSMKTNDTGYVFLPEGSGSLVRFEDVIAKGTIGKITGSLYGPDYTYYQISEKNAEQYTMPVFGLVNSSENNGTGYFAIIEEGDAMASVTANVERNYGSAYATFKYAEYDTYDIDASLTGNASSTTEITVVSKDFYKGNYKVSYKLLTADKTAEKYGLTGTYDTTYIGMAKLYRDYLTKNGTLSKIESADDDVKLFLEFFGSIKVKEQFLTFPVTVNKELTTFADIIEIQKELSDAGVSNNSFILKGFYNGGLSSYYPTKIKWQRVLGGKNGVKELLADAKSSNYEVAIDVDFSYSYVAKKFIGYKAKTHAIKTLDNRYTTKRVYYAATQTFERTSGVAVSSASFIDLFNKFLKSVDDYDLTVLATRTLGSDLNSDFDVEDYYTREDSKNNVVNLLKYMTNDENGFGLILDVGNAYSVGYADGIISAPLDSSKYVMASEAIPFYGMVYHGSIEFAGNALNMEGDEDYMFLRALENGAALYYTLAKQEIAALKFDSEYSKYYSVSYDYLKDTIISTYKTHNGLMKDKQNKYIDDHQFLNDDMDGVSVTFADGKTTINNSLVVLVTYEGGDGFILNYNSETVFVTLNENGTDVTYEVGAMGYLEYNVIEKGVKIGG